MRRWKKEVGKMSVSNIIMTIAVCYISFFFLLVLTLAILHKVTGRGASEGGENGNRSSVRQ